MLIITVKNQSGANIAHCDCKDASAVRQRCALNLARNRSTRTESHRQGPQFLPPYRKFSKLFLLGRQVGLYIEEGHVSGKACDDWVTKISEQLCPDRFSMHKTLSYHSSVFDRAICVNSSKNLSLFRIMDCRLLRGILLLLWWAPPIAGFFNGTTSYCC